MTTKQEKIAQEKADLAWDRHFHNMAVNLDIPATAAVLLGLNRESFLEMASACYDYWANMKNLEPSDDE